MSKTTEQQYLCIVTLEKLYLLKFNLTKCYSDNHEKKTFTFMVTYQIFAEEPSW